MRRHAQDSEGVNSPSVSEDHEGMSSLVKKHIQQEIHGEKQQDTDCRFDFRTQVLPPALFRDSTLFCSVTQEIAVCNTSPIRNSQAK